MKAKIIEIFGSIQGEGPYVGEEHLFVRFYGCNLSCGFCDERKKTYFLEYSVDELVKEILESKEKTVSLTGGEPLLHVDFLKGLLPGLRNKKRVYLETNGILKDQLSEVVDLIDIISMDFKLSSSTGLDPYWDEHTIFLNEAHKKEVFVKAVVHNATLLSDIEIAASIIRDIDKNIPFIIQPVSYNGNIEKIDLLAAFFESAQKSLCNVRVIPQVHKILGVN